MKNFNADLNVVTDAIKKASMRIARDFCEIEKLQVSKKGVADFVTNADLQAEKTLITSLRKARAQYNFLTEESGEIRGIDIEDESVQYKWIIDPIDGTFNFMHGIPFFCISIALIKIEDNKTSILLGVICNPSSNEIFWAGQNAGAYIINHIGVRRKMRVTEHDNFEKMICGINNNGISSFHKSHPEGARYLEYIQQKNVNIRMFGASALDMAYLADGRINILILDKMNIWDYAAGLLLIREAGGVVKDFNGKDFQLNTNSGMIAGNTKIVTEIQKNSKSV